MNDINDIFAQQPNVAIDALDARINTVAIAIATGMLVLLVVVGVYKLLADDRIN